uniref:Uncharacterized protein n=1 Tax=Rhizophora mucronata TaxID=61149 RepID=A0A2P2MPR8_RHIMU
MKNTHVLSQSICLYI